MVDYSPALLDDLTSSGEVLWRGHGSLPGDDGWVSLHLADTAHLTLAPPTDLAVTEQQQALLDALAGGGAYFFRTLSDAVGSLDDEALLADLWSLTWAGHLSNDTLTPLRAHLAGGRTDPHAQPLRPAHHEVCRSPRLPGRPLGPARAGSAGDARARWATHGGRPLVTVAVGGDRRHGPRVRHR